MTQLPHVLKRIRLNLARSKEFPLGSDRCGYEFVAPLDARGHIDVELWRKHREHCGVRRFWEGQDDQVGRLVHQPGGPEHGRWAFDYDDSPEGETTKPDTASLITCFGLENMYRSGAKTANCTPFRWSRSNPRHEGLCNRSS
jgi:hypothetical protein